MIPTSVMRWIILAGIAGIWAVLGLYIWNTRPEVQVCHEIKRRIVIAEWAKGDAGHGSPEESARALFVLMDLERQYRDLCDPEFYG